MIRKSVSKKRSGIKRAVEAIDPSELEALPTKALLARLQRLRHCEESPDHSDLLPEETAQAQGKILFKSDPLWQSAFSELKKVLATREHIDR